MVNFAHLVAQPIGWGARAVGSAQNLLPGQGDSSLNQVGRAITDPNATLSNPSGLLSGSQNAFTDPTQQPGYGITANRGAAVGGSNTTGEGAYTEKINDNTKAANLAGYDAQEQLLRSLLTSTGTKLGQGLTQLGDDYNKETSNANEQRSRALEDFAVKTQDTTTGKDQALGRVDTNARTLANSLRQRIGLAAGSGSSAYQVTAPGAVARDASLQRGDVVDTYGKNFRDLDTAQKRAETDFGSLLSDLASQKQQKESGLREGILSQEQGIYGQLSDLARQRAAAQGQGQAGILAAGAPDQSQVTSRQSQIDALFNQFRTPYSVKSVDVQTPNLQDYTVDRAAIGGGTAGTDAYSPYSQLLKKQFDDQQLV